MIQDKKKGIQITSESISFRAGAQYIIQIYQEMLSEKLNLIEIEQKFNEMNEKINFTNQNILFH